MARAGRMRKEIKLLRDSPPYGVSCWSREDNLDELEAQILGGDGTPYSGGIFTLEISIPDRYPFEPPKVRFRTPIYHPNIDNAGRICLDSLKMPPKGAWRPSLNISTILTTIQLLMAEPNADDPLMAEIANEFRHNRPVYLTTARKWTEEHAFQNVTNFNNEENLYKNCDNKNEDKTAGKRMSSEVFQASSCAKVSKS